MNDQEISEAIERFDRLAKNSSGYQSYHATQTVVCLREALESTNHSERQSSLNAAHHHARQIHQQI